MIEELVLIDSTKKIKVHRLRSGDDDTEKCIYIHHHYMEGYCSFHDSADKDKRRDIDDEAFLLDANKYAKELIKIEKDEKSKLEQKKS